MFDADDGGDVVNFGCRPGVENFAGRVKLDEVAAEGSTHEGFTVEAELERERAEDPAGEKREDADGSGFFEAGEGADDALDAAQRGLIDKKRAGVQGSGFLLATNARK